MEQPISLQLYQAGFALLTGVAAGALYDCFRALRRQINRPGFTNLADVLFWVMLALALFLQTMAAGRGEVRIFMLIATTGGAILYFLALSAYFLKILEKCLNKILCVLRFVIIPAHKLWEWRKKVSKNLKKSFKNGKKRCIIGLARRINIRSKKENQERGECIEEQTGKYIYQTSRIGSGRLCDNHPDEPPRPNRAGEKRPGRTPARRRRAGTGKQHL